MQARIFKYEGLIYKTETGSPTWKTNIIIKGERGGGINEEFGIKHTTIHKMGFPGGSAGKESTCNVGNQGSLPGFGRSPGEGKG